MSKFSRWTPTLGVCFKWDSQKVLKIAHFGVFRHIGGTWGVQKHMYLKIYWVKVISSKNGDFWTPQCWEINFFRQNIGMFDWLFTETYANWSSTFHFSYSCFWLVGKGDIVTLANFIALLSFQPDNISISYFKGGFQKLGYLGLLTKLQFSKRHKMGKKSDPPSSQSGPPPPRPHWQKAKTFDSKKALGPGTFQKIWHPADISKAKSSENLCHQRTNQAADIQW